MPPKDPRPPRDRPEPDAEADATTRARARPRAGEGEVRARRPIGPALPERIGPYRIVEVLGEGGMGTVCLAEQEEPVQRSVALKLIKPGMDSADVIARFESERQALAIMNHPGVARVFDAGMTELGRPYFVMEYVPGIPITEYCDRHRLDTAERLRLLVQVCQAIQHAHQKGIIHRDIKPSNVLVTVQDDAPAPKVIDFGIAKATTRLTDATFHTSLGEAVGTPEYMSPEQADLTSLDIDSRTDIYSLGVLLYELLVGDLPFARSTLRGVTPEEMRRVLRDEDPPTPSQRLMSLGEAASDVAARRRSDLRVLGRQLRGDLDWITMRAMEKDRTRRYASASELAADLERYLDDEPVTARPPSLAYRLGKLARKNKGPLAASAAVLLTLLLGTVTSTWLAVQASHARTQADQRRVQAEDLISFMLGDLRDKLTAVGRLEILDDVGDQAMEYFESIPPEELSDQELFRRSQALYQVGDVRFQQGDLPAALAAFRESLQLAEDMARRDPANDEWQLGLGASHFYVGYAAFENGDLETALAHFRDYLQTSERLVAREPDNPTYRLEVGYAHSNIGAVLEARGDLDGALEQFRRCLAIEADLVARDPHDLDLKFDLADSYNAVGTVLQRQGKLQEAERSFLDDLGLKQALVDAAPDNSTWRHYLGNSHNHVGEISSVRGETETARAHFQQAVEIFTLLTETDASNTIWRRELAVNQSDLAQELARSGQWDRAFELYRAALSTLEGLVESAPTDHGWRLDLASTRLHLGRALLSRGDRMGAEEQASIALRTLPAAEGRSEIQVRRYRGQAHILTGRIRASDGDRNGAESAWEQALHELEPVARGSTEYRLLIPWAEALLRLGRHAEARPVLERLDASGAVDSRLEGLRRNPDSSASRGPAGPDPGQGASSDRRTVG